MEQHRRLEDIAVYQEMMARYNGHITHEDLLDVVNRMRASGFQPPISMETMDAILADPDPLSVYDRPKRTVLERIHIAMVNSWRLIVHDEG